MLLEDCTEVLYVYKSSLHGDIQDAIALLQILGSLLQTDESHEVLRSLPCQSLQLAIKERTAHRHLPAKAVDGEAGVAHSTIKAITNIIGKGKAARRQCFLPSG